MRQALAVGTLVGALVLACSSDKKPGDIEESAASGSGGAVAGGSGGGGGADSPPGPEGIELLRSDLAYVAEPAFSETDFEALQQGHRAFALELYRQLAASADPEQNLLLSPYSVSTLMAMTYAGARGNTAAQIASALHFDVAPAALHPAMNALAQRLGQTSEASMLSLYLLNALWVQRNLVPEAAFLDTLSQHYDTGIYLVDFVGDPAGARQRINDSVLLETQGLIGQLFSPDTIDSRTRLALSNTVYLSAPWGYPFDGTSTQDGSFTLPSGGQVTVPLMRCMAEFPYVFDADWSAAELPYAGTHISMIAVLPNEGGFAEFEYGFDAERLSEIVEALASASQAASNSAMLYLSMPKFAFDSSLDLDPPLQQLGVIDAFSLGVADFSGIGGDVDLAIDTAVQKTAIAVDEVGTVAASGTGEGMLYVSITPSLYLTRPFVFFIYDRDTGTVLFVGRLMHP